MACDTMVLCRTASPVTGYCGRDKGQTSWADKRLGAGGMQRRDRQERHLGEVAVCATGLDCTKLLEGFCKKLDADGERIGLGSFPQMLVEARIRRGRVQTQGKNLGLHQLRCLRFWKISEIVQSHAAMPGVELFGCQAASVIGASFNLFLHVLGNFVSSSAVETVLEVRLILFASLQKFHLHLAYTTLQPLAKRLEIQPQGMIQPQGRN
eukprot:3685834-Rhodomonas_salina.2